MIYLVKVLNLTNKEGMREKQIAVEYRSSKCCSSVWMCALIKCCHHYDVISVYPKYMMIKAEIYA